MRAAATRSLAATAAASLLALATAAGAARHPALDPPAVFGGEVLLAPRASAPSASSSAPTTEWELHVSADGEHPDGAEQAMMWLMNRARDDPAAEGLWLATESHPEVSSGRTFFGVDTALLEEELAAMPPAPPAAFDRRLYEAARAHSLDLIASDAQDHHLQFQRIDDAGFDYTSARGSVFSYASSALNAHAAFNIDWGPNPPTGMQEPPGHRLAIMGDYPNVGLAAVPAAGGTVGPLVVTANYAAADPFAAEHYNRFLVGTVWEDDDGNGLFDPGEGFGGVTVRPDRGPFYAVTAPGGGYAFPVTRSGSYSVTFSGGALLRPVVRSVEVGTTSALLDATPVPEPAALLQLGAAGAALAALRAARRPSGPSGDPPPRR